MILIFIFSTSFKQLSWSSASAEGQNSNCNHDESSASNFDFGNWAKVNLPNLHERNDRHCAATTGENALSIQRFGLSTLRPGVSRLNNSKPHDASQLFTGPDHPSASEQEKHSPFCVRANHVLLWTRLTSTTPDISNNHLEGYFRDLEERSPYWDNESTTSISSPPDSTADVTTITTLIRSVSQPSDVDFESAAPENIPETPPVAACYAPKKRKVVFSQF